jgi:hypothetical protein
MQTKTYPTEEVSSVLAKALTSPDASVEHYREHAIWDQAIISALAVFASRGMPLPDDVREAVQELIELPGINPKLRKGVLYQMARIPA